MADENINCRMNAKITLDQCRKRQLGYSFYKPRHTDPRFIGCGPCEHFMSDEEYAEATKGQKPRSGFNIPVRGKSQSNQGG